MKTLLERRLFLELLPLARSRCLECLLFGRKAPGRLSVRLGVLRRLRILRRLRRLCLLGRRLFHCGLLGRRLLGRCLLRCSLLIGCPLGRGRLLGRRLLSCGLLGGHWQLSHALVELRVAHQAIVVCIERAKEAPSLGGRRIEPKILHRLLKLLQRDGTVLVAIPAVEQVDDAQLALIELLDEALTQRVRVRRAHLG